MTQKTRKTRAADELVGPPFHLDPFYANILHQDEDMSSELADVRVPDSYLADRLI